MYKWMDFAITDEALAEQLRGMIDGEEKTIDLRTHSGHGEAAMVGRVMAVIEFTEDTGQQCWKIILMGKDRVLDA